MARPLQIDDWATDILELLEAGPKTREELELGAGLKGHQVSRAILYIRDIDPTMVITARGADGVNRYRIPITGAEVERYVMGRQKVLVTATRRLARMVGLAHTKWKTKQLRVMHVALTRLVEDLDELGRK